MSLLARGLLMVTVMATHRRQNKSQEWVVFVLVIQWTVVFCGFMAALIVLMLK